MAGEGVVPVWAELDLERLEGNYIEVSRRCGPGIKIIASIKADAYGHGAQEIAWALRGFGVFALATGSMDDAIAIRQSGIDTPILMFGSYLPEGIEEILRHDLIPTIYNMEGARAVSEASTAPVPIYIKVDAGLGRLGVPLAKALDFVRNVVKLPRVQLEGLYTHVPFVDAAGRDWAAQRLTDFDRLVATIEDAGTKIPVTQARASSCLVAGLQDRANAVCVGHVLYGMSPLLDDSIADLSGLRPVLRSIKSCLIHVMHHAAGSDIAIGGHYGLGRAKTTGVIPAGMSSGLRRPLGKSPASALLRGTRVPIISVSLEHATLDLDAIDSPRIGEEVMLLGVDGAEAITLADMAHWLKRSPLEVVMMFSGRIALRYSDPVRSAWAAYNRMSV